MEDRQLLSHSPWAGFVGFVLGFVVGFFLPEMLVMLWMLWMGI